MLKQHNHLGIVADIKNFRTNSKKVQSLDETVNSLNDKVSELTSYYGRRYFYTPIYSTPFSGEKTPGEMGAVKNYILDYERLRLRSWQSYLESEITQAIINKKSRWVIGSGLKVQPEINELVLKQEGISFDSTESVKQIESRFALWADSLISDYYNQSTLNTNAFESYKNSKIGGDLLVVARIENKNLTIQIIDGAHIGQPFMTSKFFQDAKNNGNRIIHGVEINEKNQHIAYFIRNEKGEEQRIQRYGDRTGTLLAWMVYGGKYRIDNIRGLPLMSANLETLKKLDRYKEATVGSAEERQKIVYAIQHGTNSTGESPYLAKLQQSGALGMGEAIETKSVDPYEAAATKIAITTNKQVANLPIDAELIQLASTNELSFKDFYDANIKGVCAAVDIPFEVAMSMFNSNYSASRAAIKDWEHSMKVDRMDFAKQFYQPIYNLWLELQVLHGKVQLNGYLKSSFEGNKMAVEAFQNARWLGANVPHIDPLKEVAAERMKLGDDYTPLTDYDQTTEGLGSGDFSSLITKVKEQKKLTEDMNLKPEPAQPAQGFIKNSLYNVVKETLLKIENE